MGVGAGIAAAAGIGAVGSIASGVIGGNAAKDAANTQAQAARDASATTMAMFNKTQSNLQPFIGTGTAASSELGYLLGLPGFESGYPGSADGTVPPGASITAGAAKGIGYGGLLNPLTDPSSLMKIPGYEFTLKQGLQAAQNGFAAQGLGSSGSAIKGAANYAEGLAGTTYWNNINNLYSLFAGPAAIGANAAGGLASASTATSGQLAGLTTGAGAAQAAGTVGAANALTGGLGGVGSAASQGLLLNALFGQNAGMFAGSPSQAAALAVPAVSSFPGIANDILFGG